LHDAVTLAKERKFLADDKMIWRACMIKELFIVRNAVCCLSSDEFVGNDVCALISYQSGSDILVLKFISVSVSISFSVNYFYFYIISVLISTIISVFISFYTNHFYFIIYQLLETIISVSSSFNYD